MTQATRAFTHKGGVSLSTSSMTKKRPKITSSPSSNGRSAVRPAPPSERSRVVAVNTVRVVRTSADIRRSRRWWWRRWSAAGGRISGMDSEREGIVGIGRGGMSGLLDLREESARREGPVEKPHEHVQIFGARVVDFHE